MITGILDYPAQWPLPPSISPETPPNVDVQPLLALPEPTTPVVTTQDNAPAVETCSDSAIAADHAVNHIEVNIQADGLVVATRNHKRVGPESSGFCDQIKCNYPMALDHIICN